jgi:multidrug transporter EmrE-like cation transporter
MASWILLAISAAIEVLADIFFKIGGRNWLIPGFATYFIASVLWGFALRGVPLSEGVVVFTLLNTTFAIIAGCLIFAERLNALQVAGIVLACLSIALISYGSKNA